MEIVFSFDTTGSMASCIQEVHRKKIFYSKSNMKSITKINSLSNLLVINYRPQRSWAKVIFSQACVKNSVHGGGVSASVHAGIPPGAHPPRPGTHPQEQTPPGVDPQTRHPPRTRHLPRTRHPPGSRPPGSRPPPRGKADCSIRSMSGRYASYWNAFLLMFIFSVQISNKQKEDLVMCHCFR